MPAHKKILLVAATGMEMKSAEHWKKSVAVSRVADTATLITGAGMLHTAARLGAYLAKNKIDLAINLGIAGSFNPELKTGDVVEVQEEIIGDFGAEDGEKFLSAFDIGLFSKDDFPFAKGKLINPIATTRSGAGGPARPKLRQVRGITVNTVHGEKSSIERIRKLYNPDIETMESAAFFFCCIENKIPFLALRAISNKVERRNKKNWNIPLALQNLKDILEGYLNSDF